MKSIEDLEKNAIRAAVKKDWNQAIRINLSVLKIEPENISALNRLAWAYTELGKTKKAKTAYNKVLKIDKYNLIAAKNLKRLAALAKKQPAEVPADKTHSLFIEESGKTRVVSLVRLAPSQVLAGLQCAEPIELVPKKRFICVRDRNNCYLGILPDDLSFRLLKMIKGGNQYQAWIKSVDKQSLQIFIRETKRGPKFKNVHSFPTSTTDYRPYLSPESVHKEKPKMTPTGEDEA
jgi:tetratricopeptide (TPR) repeat protein